jgi:hypothetical protein
VQTRPHAEHLVDEHVEVHARGRVASVQRYKSNLKATFETSNITFLVQGLKPGGFKLWVDCIQLVQTPALGVHARVRVVAARGVAFERANFETRISSFRGSTRVVTGHAGWFQAVGQMDSSPCAAPPCRAPLPAVRHGRTPSVMRWRWIK